MMKQIIGGVLAISLCLSLASCSPAPKDGSPESSTASSQATSSTVSLPESSLPEDSSSPLSSSLEPSETPVSETDAPVVSDDSDTSQPSGQRETVRVTIPEGFSLAQIGERLEQNGVCTKADLLETANSYDFSYYPLVAAIPDDPNRCFKLEGYLFPNTYDFYVNMKPQDALGKMLRGMESAITAEDQARAQELGYSMDQIIILASIIEREAGNKNEVKNVSSVFHNRLKVGQKLQADATITYVENYLKPNITGDINRYNSFYNTYKCDALPSGPIANPGRRALDAALYPADTNYYYFVNDANANYYYAETFEEHQANIQNAGIK